LDHIWFTMFRSIVLLLVLFKLFFLVCGQFPCNIVASDGSTYDLTRLAALGTISGTDSSALWTYSISVCGNKVQCGTGETTGYCQYGVIGGRQYFFNVGYLDQTIAHPDSGGVELLYFEPTEGRSGRVFITCDPTALVSNINAITPENPLDYEFHFSSIAGCSTVPPCKVESPSGRLYDLTDFIGTSPITVSDNVGQYQYTVSVCQNSIPNCNLCSPAGYCQTSLQGQKYCVGRYQNITGNADGTGVVLYYEEPQEGRKGKVIITCNPDSNLISNITAVSPSLPTDYEFRFTSYAACPAPPSCKATAPDGSSYDLAELAIHPPLWGIDSSDQWNYTISICQNILSCDNCNPAGYCQTTPNDPEEYCIGTFDSIEGINQGQGVKLVYKEPIDGRLGTVTVSCNPNGTLVSDITVVSPPIKTGYQFNFKSSAACSKN